LLPFGYFTQEELANMKTPGLVYMMAAMVGPWGGALLSIGLTISVFGAWISWSMLPVEATTQLAEQKLLPSWFAKMNDKGAPVNGLWLTQWVIQVFFIVSYFITNVYDVFVLLCTAVMMICYALVGAYYAKIGFQTKDPKAIIIGGFACLFQVAALYFSGWQFLWLSMILYAVGFILYALSKREYGEKVHGHELVVMSILSLLGVTAIWGVFTNFAGLQDALGMDGLHLMFAVVPLVIITIITYFTINRHIDENKAS
jgi:arginine:ornithine antiporter/lysine permease